jgi:cytochrome c peroxidase
MAAMVMIGGGIGACAEPPPEEPGESEAEQGIVLEQLVSQIPNNLLIPNARGFAASFSTAGFIALDNAFFTPQGTNGRHCGTCHAPETGWTINGPQVTALFLATDGTHPIFAGHIDTDTPTADMTTTEARWNATTMLRQGKFTRQVSPPAIRDYDVIAANDPFGVGTTSSLFWFRRPMPTASFRSHTVNWDSANTVGTSLRDGLRKQVRGNVPAAQGGGTPPDAVVDEIVDYELALAHAQIYLWDAGRLDADGAHGGPAAAAVQPLVAGRFDLYDAWATSSNAKRRQIWRGQELFNNGDVNGKKCRGCHDAANNGQSVEGRFFNIHTSRPELAKPDMAVYTFQSRVTGQILVTTDPGLGIRDGQFASLGKIKVPNLRGLVSRAPYFHNGIAADLAAVVHHYEAELGFVFTPEQRADLVAFLEAL